MKKNNPEAENNRLPEEVKRLKKENKSLEGKLKTANRKKSELRAEDRSDRRTTTIILDVIARHRY
jgi:septal ring factor EnvC (AmiA/AmiB activator)